jgi:hypothetical protein
MTDLLQSAMKKLETIRKEWMSQLIWYESGSEFQELQGTPQAMDIFTQEEDGSIVVQRVMTWIINIEDLGGGISHYPHRGDTITASPYPDYGEQIYTVIAPRNGAAYEWADPYQICLRVYTTRKR